MARGTRWLNLDQKMRRLANIPPKVRTAVENQFIIGANEVTLEMKRVAPVDEGDLVQSIHWQKRATNVGFGVTIRAGGALTFRPVREGRTAPMYDYALAVELGTGDTPAQPFFYPVWRANRRYFMARITATWRKAIRSERL